MLLPANYKHHQNYYCSFLSIGMSFKAYYLSRVQTFWHLLWAARVFIEFDCVSVSEVIMLDFNLPWARTHKKAQKGKYYKLNLHPQFILTLMFVDINGFVQTNG